MPSPTLHLSVVVAAYNEESVMAESLSRITRELATRPGVDWEIVCVDDGSSDRTGVLLDEAAASEPRIHVLHHRRNFGQGRALRTAFEACRGEVIVTLDADLSYHPEHVYRLVDALDEGTAEIALASPYMEGGTVCNVPFRRRLLSRWGNWYLARMSRQQVATSTCVVRAYRREVLDKLVLTSDGMELQLEILMKASIMGFQMREVPANLEWADSKAAASGARRVSKMRILRTVRLYLLMGWLSRPAYAFVFLSLLMSLTGGYMALVLLVRVAASVGARLGEGLTVAVSAALQEVFARYTYSVAFSGVLVLVGLQLFVFSLLMLQNKFYFEEMYRLQAEIAGRAKVRGDCRPETTPQPMKSAAA